MKPPIKHVWFDFAGTLYRETPEFNAVHDHIRYETFAGVKGIADIEVAKREFLKLYRQHGTNSATFRALGKPADFWAQARDKMDFASVLKPDAAVTRTLELLKREVPISLFTNFNKSKAIELLELLKIPPEVFTHIITGDQLRERKPSPDGFLLAIQKSDLPPEQILYVGDRVGGEILPAKKLGIKTCLLYARSDEADYCFERFADILNIFES
jgi:HAD superfamily hydrolase (TIGR01549 family)